MRFLLYSYNFSPEKTGIGKYNGELADWLVSRGHTVDVITTNPYYPEWRIHEAYRRRPWSTERRGNLTIYRCPMYIPTTVTGKSRILSDLSFILFSAVLWIRLFFKPRYDVLLAVCPSLFIGFYPFLYTRIRGGRFIYHFQDLQLDAAIQLDILRNKYLIDFLKRMERFLLQKAHQVSSISEGMKEQLLVKGVAKNRFLMLANWVDTNHIRPYPKEKAQSLRKEWGLEVHDKVILYSGNMGEKQGLEVVLEAALYLRTCQNWKFVLCGEGVVKEKLISLAQSLELTNVQFKGLLPYERLPELLALGDVHLVPQKRAAADLVMPSKLTSILAAGGIAIVAAEEGTSLYHTVRSNNMALLVEPENSKILSDTIKIALFEDQAECKKNALLYARKYLEKEQVLKSFEKDIRLAVL